MGRTNTIKVFNQTTGNILVESAHWCSSHLCRLRGLQFRRSIKPGEGLILAKSKDSIANSSIHMFFVFFPIAAIWINSENKVTSAQLAQPWRPYYASPEPSCYVLETTPDVLDHVSVGDRVAFIQDQV